MIPLADEPLSGAIGLDPSRDAGAAIRTQALTKVYRGGTKAVDSLDLSVLEGEIFGLLGPNGAGKSTTAGMLTTRVVPTSGAARVAGIDVVSNPTRAKQMIGVVPQQNTLDRSLTVFENLYFHGRFFGMTANEARAESTKLIDRIKLNRFVEAEVQSLSGGMSQRLMLARAIMHRPPVLFLDEPTAGLDPQSRLALYEIVQELNADGHTILLTTHHMEEADFLCNRVAIIDHGSILALDTPDGLKRSLATDTIVTICADGDDVTLDEVLAGVSSVQAVTRVNGTAVLSVSGGTGSVPNIVATVDRAGFTVRDLKVEEPTLETVFISLTGKDLRD